MENGEGKPTSEAEALVEPGTPTSGELAEDQVKFLAVAEGDKRRAEGDKRRAEGAKLWAEGDKLWAEAIIEVYGNITVEWKNWSDKKQNYECHLETGEVFVP